MTAVTKDASVYAETLGYALNSEGKLDYSALVSADMKGPFVLETGDTLASLLPFTTTSISVYKNGNVSTLSSASPYDVYYYNAGLRTVWLYNSKISGTYTAVSPSSAAPTAVTVAGNSYSIGTSSAAYKLSSMGEFSVDDTVTLLLGMNGTVVDAVIASEIGGIYYGVVTVRETNSYTDNKGKIVSEDILQIACTDVVVHQYAGSVSVGSLVSVNCSEGQTSVKPLGLRDIEGKVNSAGTMLGNLSFSEGVEILDTNFKGNYALIYPSRLAGATLGRDDVCYYALDDDGKICRLILNDTTGDLYSYGLLTSASAVSADTSISSHYEYIIDGTSGSLSSTTTMYNVSTGGAIFSYKNGAINSIKNLNGISLNSIN